MEIPVHPDVQDKLSRIATARGSAIELVVHEALEQFVDHHDWFVSEVKKGIAAAEQGDLIDHAEVRKQIDSWIHDYCVLLGPPSPRGI